MSAASAKKGSSSGHGGGEDAVHAQNSVESLVEYMVAHSRDASVQGEVCKKIAALATTGKFVRSLAQSTILYGVMSLLCNAIGLPVVLGCRTDEGALRVVEEGCIGNIITAMRNHSTHSRMQELACLALRRIAAHGSTSSHSPLAAAR